jgi:hypothetical protein
MKSINLFLLFSRDILVVFLMKVELYVERKKRVNVNVRRDLHTIIQCYVTNTMLTTYDSQKPYREHE